MNPIIAFEEDAYFINDDYEGGDFELPEYNLKKKKGPAHNPSFEIEVSLKGIRQFSATAKTIKDAEINAAKKMVDYILKNKLLQ